MKLSNFFDSDSPSHYAKTSIECIDAMCVAFGAEAVVTFCLCNMFKYIWRCKNKDGIKDLEKAKKYRELAIKICNKEDVNVPSWYGEKFAVMDNIINDLYSEFGNE